MAIWEIRFTKEKEAGKLVAVADCSEYRAIEICEELGIDWNRPAYFFKARERSEEECEAIRDNNRRQALANCYRPLSERW